MSVLFICNIEKRSASGIFNKIETQVKEFSNIEGVCFLVYYSKEKIYVDKYRDGLLDTTYLNVVYKTSSANPIKLTSKIHQVALNLLLRENISIVYFRNHFISINMMRILSHSKKLDIKIGVELPTYPYYKEQFNIRPNKIKALLLLSYDFIGLLFYYFYCTKMLVIVCNSKVKIYKKMVQIFNGIDENILVRNLEREEKTDKSIIITGVAWLHPYHGYDRLISGLNDYYNSKKVTDVDVVFNIVGYGEEIQNLKKLTLDYGLENKVIFWGSKEGNDLHEIYNVTDIMVGTLKLYKRNADIDTAIKVSESLKIGIPVITSGKIPQFVEMQKFIYSVPNNNEPINIKKIVNHHANINFDKEYIKNKDSIQSLSWNNIVKNILNSLNE